MKAVVQLAMQFQHVRKLFEGHRFTVIDSKSSTSSIDRGGPRTEPWGTLTRTGVADDVWISIVTAYSEYST